MVVDAVAPPYVVVIVGMLAGLVAVVAGLKTTTAEPVVRRPLASVSWVTAVVVDREAPAYVVVIVGMLAGLMAAVAGLKTTTADPVVSWPLGPVN